MGVDLHETQRAVHFVHQASNKVFDAFQPGEIDDWTHEQRRLDLKIIRKQERERLGKERHALRVILTRWYRRLSRFTVRAAEFARRMPVGGSAYTFVEAGHVVMEATERLKQECEPQFARARLTAVDDALQSWTDWNVYSGSLPTFLL